MLITSPLNEGGHDKKEGNIFPGATRSAHATPSALPPIDASGNFPLHMSAESPSNISHNPSEVISFENTHTHRVYLACFLVSFYSHLPNQVRQPNQACVNLLR
jgi:hypothetical protein